MEGLAQGAALSAALVSLLGISLPAGGIIEYIPALMTRLTEQSPLEGFDPPLPDTDRYFFAILPDAKAAARIARLAEQLRGAHGLKGKALGVGRLHITLHHVGDYRDPRQETVDRACDAAASVIASPFQVGLDRVGSFARRPRNMPLVMLGGDGLIALSAFQQVLGVALAKAVVGKPASAGYTPHLTLLYDDHHVPAQPIEPIKWEAREFVLVHSLIGQGRHRAVARFPLMN